MREIKFRGRCIKSNDWVCGDLIHGVGGKSGKLYILPNKINLASVKHCDPLDGVQVIPESVGQFIGLKDKKSIEIFEGDIVFGWNVNILVEFINGAAGYHTGSNDEWKEFHAFATHNHLSINNGVCKQLEIIGNAHEKPELINQNRTNI